MFYLLSFIVFSFQLSPFSFQFNKFSAFISPICISRASACALTQNRLQRYNKIPTYANLTAFFLRFVCFFVHFPFFPSFPFPIPPIPRPSPFPFPSSLSIPPVPPSVWWLASVYICVGCYPALLPPRHFPRPSPFPIPFPFPTLHSPRPSLSMVVGLCLYMRGMLSRAHSPPHPPAPFSLPFPSLHPSHSASRPVDPVFLLLRRILSALPPLRGGSG